MSSDTEELPEYELSDLEKKRNKRIKRNQALLVLLGLDKWYPKNFPKLAKRQSRPRTRKRMVEPGQERRSPRLRQKTEADGLNKAVDEEHVMLSYDSDDFIEDESKPARRSRGFRSSDYQISQEDLKALEEDIGDDYLEKFREFLVYENKISKQNTKNVMRQVTKLARGEGVRYESQKYGWPEGCYFMKGKPVTIMSDIGELLMEGQKCEDKWGADHGNGWLLRHPLKKLVLFQQFCLLNPAFLKSKCKLKQYCEVAMEAEAKGMSNNNKSNDPGVAKSEVAESRREKEISSNSRRLRRKRSNLSEVTESRRGKKICSNNNDRRSRLRCKKSSQSQVAECRRGKKICSNNRRLRRRKSNQI